MKSRCHYPGAINYWLYGGRGITVCPRWNKFVNFLDDMGVRPDGKTLDRINPDGDYEPSNCRWATPKEQMENQRPRKRIEEWTNDELIAELRRRKVERNGYELLRDALKGEVYA
jgi:hypothetical protein